MPTFDKLGVSPNSSSHSSIRLPSVPWKPADKQEVLALKTFMASAKGWHVKPTGMSIVNGNVGSFDKVEVNWGDYIVNDGLTYRAYTAAQFASLFSVGSTTPLLQPLTLSANSVAENSPNNTVVAAISGKTTGSTLSLVGSAGSRFAISGSNLVTGAVPTNYETNQTHTITINENLETGLIKNKNTEFTINVTNAFEQPSLTALTLSSLLVTSAGLVTLNILGATSGSTLTGTVPVGMTINSAARTISGIATNIGAFNIVLNETLLDSANSPRQTTIAVTVV